MAISDPSANAKTRRAQLFLGSAQGMDERDEHARSRRADRMAERDGPSQGIDFCWIDLQFPQHGNGLRGEGLVQFEKIDVRQCQSGALEGCRNRANAGPMPMWAGSTPAVA